jgi:hypothetical protein
MCKTLFLAVSFNLEQFYQTYFHKILVFIVANPFSAPSFQEKRIFVQASSVDSSLRNELICNQVEGA